MTEFKHMPEDDGVGYRQPTTAITVTTDAVSLEELVPVFERFLSAIGYSFPNGAHIGYEYDEVDNPTCGDVDNEVTIDPESVPDSGTECNHSVANSNPASTPQVTPQEVVEALRRQPWEDDDGLWMAYDAYEMLYTAVRELSWLLWTEPNEHRPMDVLTTPRADNAFAIAETVEGME